MKAIPGNRTVVYGCLLVMLTLSSGCKTMPPEQSKQDGEAGKGNAMARRVIKRQEQAMGSVAGRNYYPGSTVWRWTGWSREGVTGVVEQPAAYTLQLLANGWFKIKADCHSGEGMYETMDDRIVMLVTRVGSKVCGKASREGQFVEMLESVVRMRSTQGALWLDLPGGRSSMRFEKGQ